MKTLLFAAILLASAGVQADQQCDDVNHYLTEMKPQLDSMANQMNLKNQIYMGTTARLFPYKKAARKKDYENAVLRYNRQAESYNQQVERYEHYCK